MRNVYLHVGPVKTGSTYLQDLLWRNRDDLARQGYLHPSEHANEMWLATNDLQECAFVHFDMPEAAGVWATVCDRVLSFDGPSIMSHEVLGMSTDAHVARIVDSLPGTRLHVIVMARSLAPTLPSLWQEHVKMADPDITWPEFLASQRDTKAPLTDASVIVKRWLTHVSPADIHVVTVPPRNGGTQRLLDRFAEATGLDTVSWVTDRAVTNQSLDMVQAELLRRLNLATANSLDIRAQRRLLQGALLPCLRTANPERRIRIPTAERDWIQAETTRRIEALRHSGAVIHGDLADLDVPSDVFDDDPLDITDAVLLHEALHLLASTHPDTDSNRIDII